MGQGIGRVSEAPAVNVERGGREPIGRYLAQQRRLRGIELEDLATRTRIPRRSLERLEAGAFDHSPDGFSRGFVRTVAEAIGVDPDDAVARMLPEPDTARARSRRPGRALGAIAAAVALAGLALGANELASRILMSSRATPGADLPVRHDYVRELAEQHGIRTAELGPRAAQLEPLPPPTPVVADVSSAEVESAVANAPAEQEPRVAEPTAAPSAPARQASTPAALAPAAVTPTRDASGLARPEATRSAPTPAPPPPASAANFENRPSSQTHAAESGAAPIESAPAPPSLPPTDETREAATDASEAAPADGTAGHADATAEAPAQPDAEARD